MKPIILFFGDSYANAGRSAFGPPNQSKYPVYPVYTDIVADALNMDPLIFGYGGASWWFSRCRMLDYFGKNPDVLSLVAVVVAMHTSSIRINSSQHIINERKIMDDYYAGDWYDIRFHDWSRKQWFKEFSSIFHDKKIINFFCFPDESIQEKDLASADDLHGTVVQDPMIHITVSEFAGTREQIIQELENSNDFKSNMTPHHNHMNAQSHQSLAVQIINFIESPNRIVSLDFSKFDVKNPNYHQWPDGRFWTVD